MQTLPVILTSETPSFAPDCDCAPQPVITWPELQLSQGWRLAPYQVILRQKGWYALFLPYGPSALVVLDETAWQRLQTFSGRTLTHLDDAFLAQAQGAGLLHPTGQPLPTPPAEAQGQVLTAWISLSNACNLRCDYCYVQKTAAHLDLDTGRRIIDRLVATARKAGYPKIKLKYAGGEPLLNFTVLQQVHAYALQRTRQHGLALEAVIITNGTLLTDEHLAFLKEYEIQLAVSLDGLAETHDAQRHYANGRGSFRQIIANLAHARQSGLMPLVNITISGKNAAGLPALVAYLLEQGYRFAFNLYRPNVFIQDEEALALEEDRIITAILQAYEVIAHNLPDWNLLGALTDRANLQTAHQHTCSAGRDYLVFDHQGRVSQCQMLLHLPVSNLEDENPLDTVRAASALFGHQLQNLAVDEKEDCSTCQWRYWCAGGCPLEAKRAGGSFAARSPNCHIYQAILPRVLELEAQRLIEQAQKQPT